MIATRENNKGESRSVRNIIAEAMAAIIFCCCTVLLGLYLTGLPHTFAEKTFSSQKGDAISGQGTNPYSQLENGELAEKATAFIKSLRALNDDFRKAMNGISVKDRNIDSKLREVDNIQVEYDRKFATQARNLEKELLRRLPNAGKPKDPLADIASGLIKSGRLAGADPPNTIAAYLEALVMRLPQNTPRK
jgi:hypothetical protein